MAERMAQEPCGTQAAVDSFHRSGNRFTVLGSATHGADIYSAGLHKSILQQNLHEGSTACTLGDACSPHNIVKHAWCI